MQILLIEPFFSGSHRQWALGFQQYSGHEVQILSLPGRHWKWRMYGGAVSLARQFLDSNAQPDLILASDMFDLPTFLAISRSRSAGIPVALYFHENQITYPWSPADADLRLQRNNQYGFINYTSALVADQVFFNSAYHQHSFLSALPAFLQQFPDHRELALVDSIREKSEVLPLGMDLQIMDNVKPVKPAPAPLILWNHRWEYDKNPDLFFETLLQVKAAGQDFKLVVLGEAFRHSPKIFKTAQKELAAHILHFGYAETRQQYLEWLQRADILPVTSNQDFFGGSVVEAIYAGCYPLLPDRLAFPEHIPPPMRSEHLYANDFELLPRLLQILSKINQSGPNTSYRNFVAHYDWRILAPDYDQRMEQLSSTLHP